MLQLNCDQNKKNQCLVTDNCIYLTRIENIVKKS